VLGHRRSVAEGVYTAAAIVRLAAEKGVEMPICGAVHAIVDANLSVDDAIEALLSRPQRSELG
jgi:glycerol-3-phosphate dehydrogenase (NAD(P)+)